MKLFLVDNAISQSRLLQGLLMRLKNCYRSRDFRALAKRRLPSPLFHYIDGGADDEVTLARNIAAFDDVELVPNVLAGVESVDLSTHVLGEELSMPFFFSPVAMLRLFHHDGEDAVARVAEEQGTLVGLSSLGTRGIEYLGKVSKAPKLFQIYVHNDPALTNDMIARCKEAGFSAIALTVDTIVAGNRERDYLTGMTYPPKLTAKSLASFAIRPGWSLSYLFRERLDLPNIAKYSEGEKKVESSVVDYINSQLRCSINWDDAAHIIESWGGPFAIKGVMSVDDARRAVDIGASAIMISNHGGRQLDGSRAPFDQLKAILDAVGGDIEVIVDGGIRRGTHVVKAMALGATACSGGRAFLYPLAGAGYAGVSRAADLLKREIERDMYLMGCENIKALKPSMLVQRKGVVR